MFIIIIYDVSDQICQGVQQSVCFQFQISFLLSYLILPGFFATHFYESPDVFLQVGKSVSNCDYQAILYNLVKVS